MNQKHLEFLRRCNKAFLVSRQDCLQTCVVTGNPNWLRGGSRFAPDKAGMGLNSLWMTKGWQLLFRESSRKNPRRADMWRTVKALIQIWPERHPSTKLSTKLSYPGFFPILKNKAIRRWCIEREKIYFIFFHSDVLCRLIKRRDPIWVVCKHTETGRRQIKNI